MPVPTDLERSITAFGDVYRRAEVKIHAELSVILDDPNQSRRVRRLRALAAEIDRRTSSLESEARAFLNSSLPSAWSAGANNAAVGQFTWTQGHRQALGLLAQDTYTEVLRATRRMSRDVKTLVRGAASEVLPSKVITGQTALGAGRELEQRLLRMGVSALTYADGRNIRASTYAEMLARTKCLPGDVPVTGARVVAAHRRFHEGEWVTVRTHSGYEFSGTPNHPMLTQRGWVPLGELAMSDHLVRDRSAVEHRPASGHEHVENRPPTIAEVFDAIAGVGGIERKRAAFPDFHGDGSDSYVHVATSDGVLCVGDFAPIGQRSLKGLLAPSDVRLVAGAAFRYPLTHGFVIPGSPSLFAGPPPDSGLIEDALHGSELASVFACQGADRSSRLVRRHDGSGWEIVAEPRVFASIEASAGGVGARAHESGSLDVLVDRARVSPELTSDRRRPEARPVQLDHVISLDRCHRAGHVYNLTTRDGYFTALDYYTGNTAAAYNLGGLNQMKGAGIRFVEVIDSADCGLVTHSDGFKPQGTVMPVEVMAAYPISHANCIRDLAPRPDVVDESEAAVAESWRSPEAAADQLNFERYLRETATPARAAGRQQRTPRSPRTSRRNLVS